MALKAEWVYNDIYKGTSTMDTDRPLLTLSEVNHLMRCAKKDKRLAKILDKAIGADNAFDIDVVFYAEDTVPEEE